MALNFPDSPTLNQVYTDTTSGFSYQWDGVVWQSYSAASSNQIKILDDISGSFNGSTQTFALTVASIAYIPANAQQLRVVLGGIVQKPLTDYTISGSNITFTTAPAAVLDCSIISSGPAVPVNTIEDGSVTPAKLSTGGPSWNSSGQLNVTGNLNVTGVVTATTFSGNVTGNVTGDITIGAGSTSAPSLAPSGDSNTGVFFPSADTIAFAEGGAEAARLDSSGRLLVGTTTARDNVNLWSINRTPTVQIETAVANNNNGLSLINNNGSGWEPFLTLASSGGSSIGSNTAVSNNSAVGSITFSGNDGDQFLELARISGFVDGTSGNNDMPGRLAFYTTADGASSPTERVRILSNGVFKASATGSYINSSSQNYELTNTGNNNILNMYHVDANGGNCGGIYLKYENAAPNNSGLMIRGDDNVAMRFIIRNNGGISNYQANDSNLCDEREKKNIVDLDSTWDCLKHWELKKFHYNEDDNDSDLRYGVIAQQISLHCPEVITEWIKQNASEAVLDEDGNEIEPAKEEIVRLAVKEQQMYWMAIKALQEAQERIETLEAQNAAILARLDAAGL